MYHRSTVSLDRTVSLSSFEQWKPLQDFLGFTQLDILSSVYNPTAYGKIVSE